MNNNSASSRHKRLDITKGLLIYAMLLSHAWGTISLLNPPIDIRYSVTFVTSSYVFISGFILGKFLLPGYINNPYYRLRRDLGRASKLFLIYFIPNMLLYFGNYRSIYDNIDFYTWFVSLIINPINDLPVFEILYSISVFMAAGSTLFYFLTRAANMNTPNIMKSTGLIALVISLILIVSDILDRLVGFGFLGLSIGICTNGFQNYKCTFTRISFNSKSYLIIGITLVSSSIYFAFIQGALIYELYYIPYVLMALIGTYSISAYIDSSPSMVNKIIVMLGRHSLFIYIFQVTICRLFYLLINEHYHSSSNYFLIFISVLLFVGILMIIISTLIEFLSKYPRFSFIYNNIFR